MCGIAGYLRFDRALPAEDLGRIVQAMADTMVHRGPDDHGVWVDPDRRCALAHRRLSIIDTSRAGHQPMLSGDGRHALTYNGEIYNFQELRGAIRAPLKTRTDTEVLLEGLAQDGADLLPRLDGMYAFGLFDTTEGRLLLARDPFGEKPLYTFRDDHGFAFASELHALQAVPGFDAKIGVEAIGEYLALQYLDAPRTLYAGSRKVLPGHWLAIDATGAETSGRHFAYRPGEVDATRRSLDDLTDELEELLTRSIERRLVADVPLGAFLSGGIDSSTTVALIRRRLNLPIRTFSVGYADTEDSEHLAARRISEHLGTEHHEDLLRPDLVTGLPDLGRRLDEPNGDASCLPQLALAGSTRKHVTVAISGDGGDEMFGGYSRYTATLGDLGGKRSDREVMQRYYRRRMLLFREDDLALLLGFVPASFEAQLDALDQDLRWRPTSPLAAMRGTDAAHYLPGAVLAKVDRMSMLHSLEVRTPFLTREIAAFAEHLPDDVLLGDGATGTKRILRELAARHLPQEITSLPKRGFGFGMRGEWDGGAFVNALASQLSAPDSALRRVFDPAGLEAWLARQRNPDTANLYQVSSLIVLESYLRSHPAALPERSQGFPLAEAQRRDGIDLALADHVREAKVEQRPLAVWPATTRPPFFAEAMPTGSRCETDVPIAEWRNGGEEAPSLRDAVLSERDAETPITDADLAGLARSGITRALIRERDGYAWFAIPDDLADRVARGRGLRERLGLYPYVPPRKGSRSPPARALRLGRRIAAAVIRRASGARREESARALRPLEWQIAPLLRPPTWADLPRADFRRARGSYADAIRAVEALCEAVPPAAPSQIPPRGSPIHVTLVLATLGPGGAERQARNAALAWRRAGHRVSVIATQGLDGRLSHHLEALRAAGVVVHGAHRDDPVVHAAELVEATAEELAVLRALPGGLQARTLRTFLLLRELAPDLTVNMLDSPILYGGIASLLAGVPRIALSVRSVNPTHFRAIEDWEPPLHRALARSSRVRMLANSRAAAEDHERWLDLAPGTYHVVRNGLPESAFVAADPQAARALREGLGIPGDAPLLLAIMRMSHEKRPLLFIETAIRVCHELPSAHAMLVGDGPQAEEVRAKIEAAGLGARIHLAGRREDVASCLAAADLLALTSVVEGLPNVLLEAQAVGVPVVACGGGGVVEAMAPGESGAFVADASAESLANACSALLRDSDARERAGQAGRAFVDAGFRVERMASETLAVLYDGVDASP